MIRKKLLLINCYRQESESKIAGYHEWLHSGAAAAGLELVVSDAADRGPFPEAGECAALVISGSQKMVAAGEVEPKLLDLIRGCRRPLLGICYGHQALAAAFGARVKKDDSKHLGDEDILVVEAHRLFASLPAIFRMRESHEEIVVRDQDLERNFRVVAENGTALVEAIAHREQPFFGVQFHPEKSGEPGVRLLGNFLKMI